MLETYPIASDSKLPLPWMIKTIMWRRVNNMLANTAFYKHIRLYQS